MVRSSSPSCFDSGSSLARYLRQLNIDKDLLTMKNFNVYDPMKAGRNLTLDGQTLAHLEVCYILFVRDTKINNKI